MVVGFSKESGVSRVAPLTSDPDLLLQAIQTIDEGSVDEFPSLLGKRMQLCRDGMVSCYNSGHKDYLHGRGSFRSLLNFVTELDPLPDDILTTQWKLFGISKECCQTVRIFNVRPQLQDQ